MIARVLFPCLWLCLAAGIVAAQGFGGLGSEAEGGFARPVEGTSLTFPADHGPHPEYRIEWWYLTANLQDAEGTEYGVQWTLFRSALAPGEASGWQSPQIWFAHAAATSRDAHYVAERVARGGIGQAGVIAAPFDAWIDDWSLRGPDFDTLTVTARGPEFAYALDLQAQGPLVFHGRQGYSVKSEDGQASYYYSQPAYRVDGVLDLPQGAVAVTGQAWLDREWSSQPLSEDQSGWDWFSLSLEDGQRLMAFQLRSESRPPYTSATWIGANGTVETFGPGAVSAEPLSRTEVAGRSLPTAWQLMMPIKGLDLQIEALNPGSWMAVSLPYWEGPVQVSGSVSGRGYLEMTGYE